MNTTLVKPAAEQRAVWEKINGAKKSRVRPADLDGDDDADNTSHGAEGTSTRFIAARSRAGSRKVSYVSTR